MPPKPKNNALTEELMKMDLYKLFDLPHDATAKQIKKAYRVKALKCHPDKNRDNPKAGELFHQLSEALKILSDLGARAAYDHLRKAKQAAKLRTEKLDAKRRKVKLDLEERERAAEEVVSTKKQAKITLKQEIERLREENSRILEEEQLKMAQQIKEEKLLASQRLQQAEESIGLKLKWNGKSEHQYSYDTLMKMFSKYGVVETLVLSPKKRGTAIIEFVDLKSAISALSCEIGDINNPLRITWLREPPASASVHFNAGNSSHGGGGTLLYKDNSAASGNVGSAASSSGSIDDFESAVLRRLKEAQAKKREQQKADA